MLGFKASFTEDGEEDLPPKKTGAELRETYQILNELGRGAYGTVVKAMNRRSQMIVAIKHIDKRAAGSKGLREVMNEVETMRLLRHTNIVHLEDVYHDDANLWIVMEYVPGGELHTMLRQKGRFPEGAVRRMTFGLLVAIEFMHHRSVVHRDLKPANCLLRPSPDGAGLFDIKIADFGFAVMAGSSNVLSSYCGTMAYMAPEVVQDRNYGKPVDMWALGVIVYLLLSGEYPFMSSNSDDMPALICRGELDFTRPAWKDVSLGAKDFVSKLLRLDDSRRLTATDGLRHHWIRAASTTGDGDDDDESAEPTPADSPNTTKTILKAKGEARRRRLRHTLRAAFFAVKAAHRLVFLAKSQALLRDGLELPVLRSFRYLVGRTYHSHPPHILSGRGQCVGAPRAVAMLIQMLESSPRIETFDLGHNGIDSLETVQAVAKACGAHPTLTALNLDGNPIPTLAGRTLQRVARGAPRLRTINVANTTIGADQQQQIVAALRDAEKRRADAAASGVTQAGGSSPAMGGGATGGGGGGGLLPPSRSRSNVTSPAMGAPRPLGGYHQPSPGMSSLHPPTGGGPRSLSSHRTRSGARR